MNRRVLLVDADTEFCDTLTLELGRYGVVVVAEAEADRALALGTSEHPEMVLIAVEEPEKAGFKAFQKFRKALPAKLPIVLVTSSVSRESFAKHRGLKTHADEYIDKRDLTRDELIGKLDNLIGLGDLQDQVSIPVEDEIPMEIADGDVVLDEQLDDEDQVGSFEHDVQTIGPNSGVTVDQMVSAETDAAFDALLGDEPAPPPKKKKRGLPGVEVAEPVAVAAPEPEPEPEAPVVDDSIPEPVPHKIPDDEPMALEDSGIPEPVPHKIPDDEPEPSKQQWDLDSVPARIQDGGRPDSQSYSQPNEVDVPPLRDDDFSDEEPVHADQQDDSMQADASDEPVQGEVSDEPMEAYDPMQGQASDEPLQTDAGEPAQNDEPSEALQADESAEPIAEEEHDASRDSLSSIPMVDDDLVSLDDDMVEEVEEPEPEPAPVAAQPEPARPTPRPGSYTRPPRSPTRPPGMDEPPARPAVGEAPTIAAAPAGSARTTIDVEETVMREPIIPDAARKTGTHAAVDLGLDMVAQNAENEQSGVYDRKSLRKIGELERQISQLKTELERARAAADNASKGAGRESQFLNLREANAAKDKELKQAKTELEQQSKDLAEATEKLRQALHTKSTLEAKNEEIEQKLFDDVGKQKELATSLKAATAQASQLELELEAKTKAATAAETAFAQVERDLAAERASGATTASESERKLRVEREQLIQRHKGELAALRAEAETAQEFALSRLREELEAAQASAVNEAVEEVRGANATEHTEVVEALEQKHNTELVKIKSDHAGELSRIRNELSGEVQRLEAALAEARESMAVAVAGAEQHNAQALEQLRAEHEQALEQLKAHHAADVEAREEEANEARERDAESAGQALAQLKSTLDRTTAAHEVKLGAARREIDQLVADHETAKLALEDQLRATLGEQQAKHESEIAQFADSAKRTAESHRAALAEQQQRYEAQLVDANESAQREISEQRGLVHAAKRAAEEATGRHQAEREEMQQAHASAIGEIEAKAERALAVANGEHLKAKAVADAEHTRENNSLRAEADRAIRELEAGHAKVVTGLAAEREQLEAAHAKVVADLNAERDELKKGLSGARDSLKRSEGELASAVQTIADRNADLRAHAAAIEERDQRITELRAEIDSLEQENANYQEQVLRAYQKIKSDEAMVARARKAMAIALTVLDDQGNPTTS